MNQESFIKIKLFEPSSTGGDFLNKEMIKDFREFKSDLTMNKTFEDNLKDFIQDEKRPPAETKSKAKELTHENENTADEKKSESPADKKQVATVAATKKPVLNSLPAKAHKEEPSALKGKLQDTIDGNDAKKIQLNAKQTSLKRNALPTTNIKTDSNEKLLENSKAFGQLELPRKIFKKFDRPVEAQLKTVSPAKPDVQATKKEVVVKVPLQAKPFSENSNHPKPELLNKCQSALAEIKPAPHKAENVAAASIKQGNTTMEKSTHSMKGDLLNEAAKVHAASKKEENKPREVTPQIQSLAQVPASVSFVSQNDQVKIAKQAQLPKSQLQEQDKGETSLSLNANETRSEGVKTHKHKAEKAQVPQAKIIEGFNLKTYLTEKSQNEKGTALFLKSEFNADKQLEAHVRGVAQKWAQTSENIHTGMDTAHNKERMHFKHPTNTIMSTGLPTETNLSKTALPEVSNLLAEAKPNSQQAMNMGSDSRQNNKEHAKERIQEEYIKNALTLNTVNKGKTSQMIQQIFEPKTITHTQQAEIIPAIVQQIDRLRKSEQGWIRVSLAMDEGQEVSMHLKLSNNNNVSIRFQSNNTELKNTILEGWSELANASTKRGIQLSTPEFIDNNFETSGSSLVERAVYHRA